MRHLHRKVTVTIGKEWQLDCLADNQRHQTRRYNLRIITAAKLFLLLTQVFLVDDKDIFPFHQREYRLIGLGEVVLQDGDFFVQLFEQAHGRIVTGKESPGVLAGTAQPHDVGDTHFEKFVLIV